MQTIPDDLITVAVYQNGVEANLIKNHLEAVGIKAYLSGEEAVAMAWQLAGAFGGIKLQVATRDAEDALSFLEGKSWLDESSDKSALATAETLEKMRTVEEEDKEEVFSEREMNANRLGRAALFGLLFPPLEVYAFWLLLKVYYSSEKLEGRALANGVVGGVIALGGFMVFFMVVIGFLRVLM